MNGSSSPKALSADPATLVKDLCSQPVDVLAAAAAEWTEDELAALIEAVVPGSYADGPIREVAVTRSIGRSR